MLRFSRKNTFQKILSPRVFVSAVLFFLSSPPCDTNTKNEENTFTGEKYIIVTGPVITKAVVLVISTRAFLFDTYLTLSQNM